jgi:hypothetical protein
MQLSIFTHTSVEFWLSQSLAELAEWNEIANKIAGEIKQNINQGVELNHGIKR